MAAVSSSLTTVLTSRLTENDKPIFSHILARAWRFDANRQHSKWRTRGKGCITIYYNTKINKAKLLFFDEKYKKVRLLQYIDNHLCDATAFISSCDPSKESVQWIANDFTMDPLNPLQSQWKIKFIDCKEAALKFLILHTYHIALFNKYLTKNEFLEEQICVICYDFIHEAKLLLCGHIGCNSCITEWIESSKHSDHGSTCPKCRSLIKSKPISCLTIDHIIQYAKHCKQSSSSIKKLNLNNICICCEAYNMNDKYICCDYCDSWYHPHCVGLKGDEFETNNLTKYKCPLCVSRDTVCNNTQHAMMIEEHETLIGEVPIKAIYRWDEDVLGQPCWKKRVIDTKLQFLQNPKTGKYRMIARDNETKKVKVDQFIYDYYRKTLQIKSKKSVSWIALDAVLQKEYNKHERVSFAAKFYTENDALDFRLNYCNISIQEMNHAAYDNEEGQSVISESVISELSRLTEIKQIPGYQMSDEDRKLQELFMDDFHANIDEKQYNESMKQEEGVIIEEDDDHNDDVYKEWKNASVIAMRESIKTYHTQQQLKYLENIIRKSVKNTKIWMDEILCDEFKSSEDMNLRLFVLNDADIQHAVNNIYHEIDAWNGVHINDKNIICFNTYWKMTSKYLHQWCGDYYFNPIISYLHSYCHEICERFELNVEDLYFLQCIHCLLVSDTNVNNITDGIIHNSQKLHSQFESIGVKHRIEWNKYIRNKQIKDCCIEWIQIIIRKIKMDLLIAMYMNNGAKQYKVRAVHLGDMMRLRSGHFGKIVFIQELDDKECTHCDLHRMCVFGKTIFIGIILNEWDYYGHDGTFGCKQWFKSPKGRGLIVPLSFVDCILNDNGEDDVLIEYENNANDDQVKARIPAIKLVNTMCSDMQQKLELLPIDEQREWFNAQLIHKQQSLSTDIHEDSEPDIELGDRVRTKSGKLGYVKYIGQIAPNADIMYGLELDNMIFPGNDGTFNGVKYFTAASGRGYFTIKSDIDKVRDSEQHVVGENCVIVTNLSPVTGYHDVMSWLEKEKLTSVKTVDVYKRNGLTEGVVQFGDVVDFKYILSNLNGEKLGDRYVAVFDTEECRDAIMCLNCSKKGHLLKDCPNTIEYTETQEWSQWTANTEENSIHSPQHRRGITIYEPQIASQVAEEEVSLTVNDVETEHIQKDNEPHTELEVSSKVMQSSEIKISNISHDFDKKQLTSIYPSNPLQLPCIPSIAPMASSSSISLSMSTTHTEHKTQPKSVTLTVEHVSLSMTNNDRVAANPNIVTDHINQDETHSLSQFVKRMRTEALQSASTDESSLITLEKSVKKDENVGIHSPSADLTNPFTIKQASNDTKEEEEEGDEAKLYIFNLPKHMTLEDIMQHIQFLSQTDIHHIHRTMFCSIVTFHSAQDAASARKNLQNAECGSEILVVEDAIYCGECDEEWNCNEAIVRCHCNDWFHAKCVFDTDSNIFICKNCSKSQNVESEEKTISNDIAISNHTVNETERYLYCMDIEALYHWIDNEWNTRAQNTVLEFYKHKQNGKIRITVRDPFSFKLKLNHWIPPLKVSKLQQKVNTSKCWQWNAFDATVMKEQMENNMHSFPRHSNDAPQYIFCAKFKTDTAANKFYETFVSLMHIADDEDMDDNKSNCIYTKWSEWKQRELVKLKSVNTLQWDCISKVLKEGVDSCKLQWNMMKRMDSIKYHIDVIRKQNHDANTEDANPIILNNVYDVLNRKQWNMNMLDILWQNIETSKSNVSRGEWDIFIAEDSVKLDALLQNTMNVDELTRLKAFYAQCLHDDSTKYVDIIHDFKGKEAHKFSHINHSDSEQLQYAIKQISERISQLTVKDSIFTKAATSKTQASDEYFDVISSQHDTFSMQSNIIIPINGRIIIQMHPIAYGFTINTHSNTSIANIKSILSKKLGIDLHDAAIRNKDCDLLSDIYVITDDDIQHNLVLFFTLSELIYGANIINNESVICKRWIITTVIANIELCIELTEEERSTFYCVHDLKQKLLSVYNVCIPKQELFVENQMLADSDRLIDLEARSHDIRLLFIADESQMPLFVEYNDQNILLCLDFDEDPLSVIPVILNIKHDIILLSNNVVLDPTKSIRSYGNCKILQAESVIHVVDNELIAIKIYCNLCIANECIEIKMRKSQTIRELKHKIIRCCNMEHDDIKYDRDEQHDTQITQLDDMQLFSYLEHKHLHDIVDRLHDGNMYRLVMNNAPKIYQNDAARLCDEYFYEQKLLFCMIFVQKKIKILFPKHILLSRIKTTLVSSFEPYLTSLYAFVSAITKIKFNDMMLYSPELQKHIKPDWSGERLIAEHYVSNYIVLYFMHIPKAMQGIQQPPKMVAINLNIKDAFYCNKYHNQRISFVVNVSDSIASFKQQIMNMFPFFGTLKMFKNSTIRIRMDEDDEKLLSDYDLQCDDCIEISSVYPNVFEVFIQIMNGRKFACDISPNDTIEILRDKIIKVSDSCIGVKKIMFMGQELNDLNETIVECCIRQKSTIYAVLRMSSNGGDFEP